MGSAVGVMGFFSRHVQRREHRHNVDRVEFNKVRGLPK